jgi:hypothetical protein
VQRTNIWRYSSVNSFARCDEEGNLSALHSTGKPVAMAADAILCEIPGEVARNLRGCRPNLQEHILPSVALAYNPAGSSTAMSGLGRYRCSLLLISLDN